MLKGGFPTFGGNTEESPSTFTARLGASRDSVMGGNIAETRPLSGRMMLVKAEVTWLS